MYFAEPSTRAGRRYAKPADGHEVVGVSSIRGQETILAISADCHAMVCAADFHIAKASGSSRPVSFFQTAAVVPSTKLAVVAGNFPEAEVPSGYVSGLLRSHPGSAQNLTDFVVEGKPVSVPVETATPEPEPEPEPEVPAFVSTTWDTGMAID